MHEGLGRENLQHNHNLKKYCRHLNEVKMRLDAVLFDEIYPCWCVKLNWTNQHNFDAERNRKPTWIGHIYRQILCTVAKYILQESDHAQTVLTKVSIWGQFFILCLILPILQST